MTSANSGRVPFCVILLVLALTATTVVALAGGKAAGADEPVGWSGSITVVLTWSMSDERNNVTHREEAQYAFDGTFHANGSTGPYSFEQPVAWNASLHETIVTLNDCPDGYDFTSIGDGGGSGTGNGLLSFVQQGDDAHPDWRYNVSAGSTSAGFDVTRVNSCQGNVTFGANAFPADNAFGRDWVKVPAGQTPEQTTTLSGKREFDGVTFCCDHATVSWSLSRALHPPQCSNGRDDDGDGLIDYAGGVAGLRDPGCTSNEDDSEVDDTTPPEITPNLSGGLGSNGWYQTDVDVNWTVVDPESAVTARQGCGASTISDDTAGVTYTCSATSAGGTSERSVTVKRDATPPFVRVDGIGPIYVTGQTVPTGHCHSEDALSGVVDEIGPVGSGDGQPGVHEVYCSARDAAGNLGQWVFTYQVIDLSHREVPEPPAAVPRPPVPEPATTGGIRPPQPTH